MVVIIYVRDLQQRRIGFDVGFNFFKSTFLLKKHKKNYRQIELCKEKDSKEFLQYSQQTQLNTYK